MILRIHFAAAAALAGCTGGSSGDPVPSMFTVPNDAIFREHAGYAEAITETVANNDDIVVDLAACRYELFSKPHPLGSAFVLTHQRDSFCEVWIGGETENPDYDGSPLQYCLLERTGTVSFRPASPYIEAESCITLFAPVPDSVAYEAALTAPLADHSDGSPIVIDVDVCEASRHAVGNALAVVHPVDGPRGPRACEIFLALPDGSPGRYCAFQRNAGHPAVMPALVGDRFEIVSPFCFQPAY